MGLIYLDNIQPGMKLEKDLKCPNGRFLLPAGSQLEEKHIKIARAWGITEAYIAGISREDINLSAEARFSQKVLDKADEILLSRYPQDYESSPVMVEIYRLSRLALASDISAGRFRAAGETEIPNVADPHFNIGSVTAKFLVEKEAGLTSFPDIYYKIKMALDSPTSSAAHMAELVEKDTSLSAKLLKIVNSAFYSFPSKIDSIRRAITIIGTSELATLALGISAIESFKGIPVELTNMRSFWRHSIVCGVFARLLGSHIDNVSTERLFVSGLLHDIGRLVIFRNMPEVSAYILQQSSVQRVPLSSLEYKTLGFDHAEVGSSLMEKWKFPAQLVKNVRFHHTEQPVYIESSILFAADCLAIAFGTPVSSSNIVPFMPEKLWKSLGLSESVITSVVGQSGHQIEEIESIFFEASK